MFFLPESPRYLMAKGKFDEAEKILSRVRKLSPDHEYLQWEIAQTRAQVEAENAIRGDTNELGLMKQLFQAKGHRTRLFLGVRSMSLSLHLFLCSSLSISVFLLSLLPSHPCATSIVLDADFASSRLQMALIFFKTFSGVQAVNYYSPRIFEQLGFAGTQNALFASQSSTSSTLLADRNS